MKIKKVVQHSRQRLVEKIRQVRLKGFGQPLAYPEEETNVELCTFPLQNADPPQTYYLQERVQDLIVLRNRLQVRGYDIFALDGYLDLTLEKDDGTQVEFPILPPIMEQYAYRNPYAEKYLICDGVHRVMAARVCGLKHIQAVRISQPPWPYYAYAETAGLAGLNGIEGALPQGYLKKTYRWPEEGGYKGLFRDFNAVFPGVQEERAKGLVS